MTVQDQIHISTPSQESSAKLLTPEQERLIRIQTGVVSRLFKEYNFYCSEANNLHSKVHDMKARNACPHDINHAMEVYSESRSMVPQVESQLRTSRERLVELLHQSKFTIDSLNDSNLPKVLVDASECLRSCAVIGDSSRCSTASPNCGEQDIQVSDTEY
jgi:tubulin-specific chaperone A